MDTEREESVVLLVLEEAVEDDARARRDRHHQALVPVPDVPTADEVHSLRTGMGFGAEELDWESSRYHRVCIVAFPSSPVRTWVAAFFAAEVPWLIEAGGLSFCVPPFDSRHTTAVTVSEAQALAGAWERLRPTDPSSPTRAQWGGWEHGPAVALRVGESERCHLRVGYGHRRSFCGLRAKDLRAPDLHIQFGDVPAGRRCPKCFRLWLEDIKPGWEQERREVTRRLEGVSGLLQAFDQFDAINRAVAEAPDWPAAHAALTGPPFGHTDLQAFRILTFPVGRQTREGRTDLEAQKAGLHSWLANLDTYLVRASEGLG